jgi:catechol 2,3-dioxygenase-like lactoylglutathione lyase family enzyme
MPRPQLAGIHHVKIPVADLARSRTWYERVFGFRATWEFPEADGATRGVLGEMPGLGDVTVAMREHPQAAAGCRGFDPISFGVQDRSDLEAWASYLDTLGIRHSPVIEASFGWLLVFNDADGLELHLYTWAEHGIDQSARPGYGRRIVAETSVDASSPQMLQASR